VIVLYPDTIVYIAAPAGFATGGPEQLHQMGYHLRQVYGANVKMFYQPVDYAGDPVHPNYRQSGPAAAREVEDRVENILLVPELYASLALLERYRFIRKIMWWQSVDFFFLSKYQALHPRRSKLLHLVARGSGRLFGTPLVSFEDIALQQYASRDFDDRERPIVEGCALNLCQSHYAMDFLKRNGIENRGFLSDYLSQEHLDRPVSGKPRENIILYNPAKGRQFTARLMRLAPDLNFTAIRNMTREEVADIMGRAKLYIDFGNHPGKDRMPREAALQGCCVVTGRRGSANYEGDVPIPDEFKFREGVDREAAIVAKIRQICSNYDAESKKFDPYRDIIRSQKTVFLNDLNALFAQTDGNG
jgi:hypothetical protein